MYNTDGTWSGSKQTENTRNSVATLRDVAFSCLGRLIFSENDVAPLGVEQIYLYNRSQKLDHRTDIVAVIHQALAHSMEDARLATLANWLGMNDVEVMAVVFSLMVEEDPMVGRLLAYIQAPLGSSRPALGMLETALAPLSTSSEHWLMGGLLAGPALASGVLQRITEEAPLPEQTLKVPLGLALLLCRQPFVWPGTSPLQGEIHVPPSIGKVARQQAEVLKRSESSILVIRSGSRREVHAVAGVVAKQLGLDGLLIRSTIAEFKGLGAACKLGGKLPVFDYASDAGKAVQLPDLMPYIGPHLVLTSQDEEVKVERGAVLDWPLSMPTREERQHLWERYLDDKQLAQQLAREHMHSAGRIAELAELAQCKAQLNKRSQPHLTDIRSAAWEAEAGLLGSLAHPLPVAIPDEALVLSKSVDQDLQQLLARCRMREELDAKLGITIKARYQEGVRCLLVGPSGTGKTLVASWLATRLGLPLYRVDLASVVSKYIGETEKNLATLLSRAEHSEIVLLFDEADSLFGKRTDIKDSNDRFANSQTNYLLQRIEFYRGIVLLTSNSRDRFDSGFTRRLDKVIDFPLPSPRERRALWQSHLGDEHQVSVKQINQLAVGCDLPGGHIRNAVLTAAVEAQTESRSITFNDLLVGLVGEYRKLGRQFPTELRTTETVYSAVQKQVKR